jgi:3-deoxy-D-manno-octulosonic-acid transferase
VAVLVSLFYNLLLRPLALVLLYGPGLLGARLRSNLLARHGQIARLEQALAARPLPPSSADRPRVWLHCASMGEYEGIRPLATALRERGCVTVLSFFSISGMRNLQPDHGFDQVFYLPLDGWFAVRRLVRALRPDVFVLTKHDLWWNLLRRLSAENCRLLFINANYHSRAHFDRRLLRVFYRLLLGEFHGIHPVNTVAERRFREFLAGTPAAARVSALGETRFDRVLERMRSSTGADLLPGSFHRERFVLVAGSTWPRDEALLLPALARARELHPGLCLLLVPHEPTAEHLGSSEALCRKLGLSCSRLSGLEPASACQDLAVLIVDRIGVLAGLYRVGQLAWVGGGFTTGVHSVIEPAAYGIPVLFGPAHHVSQEASRLLAAGGAFEVADEGRLRLLLEMLLSEPGRRRHHGQAGIGRGPGKRGGQAPASFSRAILVQGEAAHAGP